jgi:hypothetical protein
MAEMLSLDGVLSFDFPRLVVRGDLSTPATHPASRPSAGEGTGQATDRATTLPSTFEMDFAARFTTPRASLDVGVPLTEVNGAVDVAGTVRAGELDQLAAVVAVESLKVADRPARAFRTNVRKPPGEDTLAIGPLQGELAGGEVAGEVHLSYPDVGPSRYGISLVLRGADVKQLAGDVEASQDLSGRLGASLALEGEWESPDSRRGRGEVDVEGREMYKIPLVLGLLQVTNLALPISSPFNQGSAAYSVNGQRVTFETIELRSNSMLMQGRGHLDFGTKQVKMTFTTDNPNWPKLPLIGDLVQGAKHELLQFHVRGTLAEPTVKAAPANTFMTTVDEVLRGSGEK